MARSQKEIRLAAAIFSVTMLLAVSLAALPAAAQSQHQLDEMSLERWAKLRETERYQLNIAEKYFREGNFKVAAGEYEKYLTLYEQSEAASFAQLKWSIAQVKLRKANTAIKEGFQSVIDYWPDSPDAIAAAFYTGRTYKDIGQIDNAKKALTGLVKNHPKQMATVFALVDLAEIAALEKNEKTRLDLWKKLTFDVPRARYTARSCEDASRSLASALFSSGAFDEAVKALATTYTNADLPPQVVAYARSPIAAMIAQSETKAKGDKIADQLIAYLKSVMPTDTGDEAAATFARQLWYHIADVNAFAARDAEVPKVYDEIIKKFGVSDEILGRLAAWHKSKSKYELARGVYRRFENPVDGLNMVAASYREEKNYDLAIKTYRQLEAQDAENVIRWKGEVAATYRQIPKYAEAIGVYTELMKEDVENVEKWQWQVALAHRDAGQLKEAVGHFRQCTNFPENYKQMAWCHRRLKQYNEALLLYNQVAGGDQNSAPWALLQIGYTREEAEQKEAAIRAFQLVCKQFPKDSHASVAHAHLQNKYKLSITLGGAKDD